MTNISGSNIHHTYDISDCTSSVFIQNNHIAQVLIHVCLLSADNKHISMITAAVSKAKMAGLQMNVTYSRMRQNALNPHSAPFRKANERVSLGDPIKNFKTWVLGQEPKDDPVYIKLDESLRALVDDNLTEFEHNYIAHTFVASSYIDAKDGEKKRMYNYFHGDTLGLKDVKTTDYNCWKVVTIASADVCELVIPKSKHNMWSECQKLVMTDEAQTKCAILIEWYMTVAQVPLPKLTSIVRATLKTNNGICLAVPGSYNTGNWRWTKQQCKRLPNADAIELYQALSSDLMDGTAHINGKPDRRVNFHVRSNVH